MKRLALVAALAAVIATPASAAFDRGAWQADYGYLKHELEGSYSHLAWMASPSSGVDLPALDRRARRQLAEATSDAEAADAIRAFVAGFHDGHFSELPRLQPSPPADKPSKRDLSQDDPARAARPSVTPTGPASPSRPRSRACRASACWRTTPSSAPAC